MPAPGPGVEVPISRRRDNSGLACSVRPEWLGVRRRGERGVRAVGDAGEGRGEAGWGGRASGREVLVAVGAGEIKGEGAVNTGGVVGDAGFKTGVKGALSGGAGGAGGARIEREELGRGTASAATSPRE